MPIPNNRRQYNIELTVSGEQFVQEHMDFVTKLRKLSIKGFTMDELKLLTSMLERIQKNMD